MPDPVPTSRSVCTHFASYCVKNQLSVPKWSLFHQHSTQMQHVHLRTGGFNKTMSPATHPKYKNYKNFLSIVQRTINLIIMFLCSWCKQAFWNTQIHLANVHRQYLAWIKVNVSKNLFAFIIFRCLRSTWNQRTQDFHLQHRRKWNFPGQRSTSTLPDQNMAAIPDTGWTLNWRHIRRGSVEDVSIRGCWMGTCWTETAALFGLRAAGTLWLWRLFLPRSSPDLQERMWTGSRLFLNRVARLSGGETTASNIQSVCSRWLFEEHFDTQQSSTRSFWHTGGVFLCKCTSACAGGNMCPQSNDFSDLCVVPQGAH